MERRFGQGQRKIGKEEREEAINKLKEPGATLHSVQRETGLNIKTLRRMAKNEGLVFERHPKLKLTDHVEQQRVLDELLEEPEKTEDQIAQDHDISVDTLRKFIKDELSGKRPPRFPRPGTEQEVLDAHAAGKSLVEIVEEYSVGKPVHPSRVSIFVRQQKNKK